MSALAGIYIKKEILEVMLEVLNKRGDKGIEVTASINDESNKYGQNVSVFVSQSKEEREAKKDKFYVGNGNVFWTNGTIVKGEKSSDSSATSSTTDDDDDDLPF